MARRFLTDIELLGFSLLNARMHPVSADPTGLGTGDKGRVWFNTTTNLFMVWNGAAAVDLLARGSQTGTQLASTISDFATAVAALRWSTMLAPNAAVAMGSQRLTSVADPTAAQDAATRNYVDTALAGLASGQVLKGSVRVAATTNISLASPGATIDGVAMQANDVVLLTGQTAAPTNGPYVWTAAGSALTRATNWDTTGEAALGSYWIVREGSNADTFAMLTNDAAVTLGTTALTFVFRGAAGATYSGGAGLTLNGTEFNVGTAAGSGVIVDADAIRLDFAVVSKRLSGLIPTASTGIFTVSGASVTINHGFGNDCPDFFCRLGSDGSVVEVDSLASDANNLVVTFPSAPAAGQYRFRLDG